MPTIDVYGVSACAAEIRGKLHREDPARYACLHLSFFLELLGSSRPVDIIQAAVQSLANGDDPIFETLAFYDDGHEQHEIEPEDYVAFCVTGELVHPVSGELIADPRRGLSLAWALRSDRKPLYTLPPVEVAIDKSDLLPVKEAPRDGTPVLMTLRSDLAGISGRPDDSAWEGLSLVMRYREGCWEIAAPFGRGGWKDEEFVGWTPSDAPGLASRGR